MKTPTIINNASSIIDEMLPVIRKRADNMRALEHLKIGEGFVTKRYRVSGFRSAAKRLQMKITAYEVDSDMYLICRKF